MEDVAALAALSRALGYPTSEANSRSRLDTILRSDDHAVLVACSPTGSVVAWVHVFLASRIESEPFAELGGFVVAETHRRQGHGRRLLAAAEAWSRDRGVEKLRVRSRIDRDDARTFYERLGFTSTKEQSVFDKPVGGTT